MVRRAEGRPDQVGKIGQCGKGLALGMRLDRGHDDVSLRYSVNQRSRTIARAAMLLDDFTEPVRPRFDERHAT
jgi:hypothetical protein